MEQEKIKKIKKVLEQNTKTCLLYDFGKDTECKVFQCKDILDYIKELESENEKYKQKLTTNQWVQEIRQYVLKQFAEILKEMPFNIEFTFKESSYEDIKKLANLMKEYSVKYIDETLKEFIGEDKLNANK